MFTPVGNLLDRLPKRSKLSGAVSALMIMRVFDEALVEVCTDLPKDKLSLVKAKTFKDGVLEVSCTGLMVSELSMRAGDLIRALNKRLARKVILKIRLRSR